MEVFFISIESPVLAMPALKGIDARSNRLGIVSKRNIETFVLNPKTVSSRDSPSLAVDIPFYPSVSGKSAIYRFFGQPVLQSIGAYCRLLASRVV